jgi:selenium-binding protein 1
MTNRPHDTRPDRRGLTTRRMRAPTIVWLTALLCVIALGAALIAALVARSAAAGGTVPLRNEQHGFRQDQKNDSHGRRQERFLYVAAIAQSATDPDFVSVIGADPRRSDFGKIVNRIDMPNVGDELHHFGYSADQRRLIVPGLFSNRIHVFKIKGHGKKMVLRAINEQLAAKSGYITPHGVMTMEGRSLIPTIGAATDTTLPGGLVEIDDRTGAFERYFGPGPARDPADLRPKYMYDFASVHQANRGISTTFGPPALCGGGIDPTCLGSEVSV